MALSDPLPRALSPSRLQDFQSCPRRYQYSAVERIPQPATYATTRGRVVHHVLEHLHRRPADERSLDVAHSLLPAALEAVVDEGVRGDLADEANLDERLRADASRALDTYATLEDPAAVVHEGVELRLEVDLDGTPLLGILDRLDREPDGSLAIIDYKTGSPPSRQFDTQTFANTELYAALCDAALGEMPRVIRLLYVGRAGVLERPVSPVVVAARADAAAQAWSRITRYHAAGDFPARPSPRSCRWCPFRARCAASGVEVPAVRP